MLETSVGVVDVCCGVVVLVGVVVGVVVFVVVDILLLWLMLLVYCFCG